MPLRPAFALLLLVLACGGAPSSSPVPDPGLERSLLAAMTESAAAWNRADLDGHVALYTDSATMMTQARGPVPGREVIKGMLARGFWQEGKPAQHLSFSDLAVTPLGRGHAMLTGRFLLSGGGKPDAAGRFTTIWKHTAAGWRIIHDHSS